MTQKGRAALRPPRRSQYGVSFGFDKLIPRIYATPKPIVERVAALLK